MNAKKRLLSLDINSKNFFHFEKENEKEFENKRSLTFIIKEKPFVPQIHPFPNEICPSPCQLNENCENEFLKNDSEFIFHIKKINDEENCFSSSDSNIFNSENLCDSSEDDEKSNFNNYIPINKNSLGIFRKNLKIEKTKTFNIANNDDFDFFRKSKNININKNKNINNNYKKFNDKNCVNDNIEFKEEDLRFKSMNFSRNVNSILEYLKNNAIK